MYQMRCSHLQRNHTKNKTERVHRDHIKNTYTNIIIYYYFLSIQRDNSQLKYTLNMQLPLCFAYKATSNLTEKKNKKQKRQRAARPFTSL